MSDLIGEFTCPVAGQVEVIFSSYLDGEFTGLNIADFRLKFFSSLNDPDLQQYRGGAMTVWDYELNFAGVNNGIFAIKGGHALYQVTKGVVPAGTEAAIGLRINYLV